MPGNAVRPDAPDRRMKLMKKALLFLVLVALALAGVAYYTQHRNGRAQDDDYKTSPVEFGEIRDIISVNAFIRPVDGKPIFSQISGQVVELYADYNATVEEGETLLRLDSRDARNKLGEAEAALSAAEIAVSAADAQLSQAKAAHESAKEILDTVKKGGHSGPVDLVKLEAQVKQAESAIPVASSAVDGAKARVRMALTKVTEAKLGLDLTTISVSSFLFADDKPNQSKIGGVQLDGVNQRPKRKFIVLDRKVEKGQNIDAKQPLFTLVADLEHMRAHAYIPESRIGRVALGQKAVFWVDALGEDVKMPAEVTEIRLNPVQQQGAIYYEVLLSIKNQKNPRTGEWQLKPGMTAPQLEITDRVHAKVWKLPVNALSFNLDDSHPSQEAKNRAIAMEKDLDMNLWTRIWIMRDGKPHAAFVRLKGHNAAGEPGIKDAEHYEILEWDAEIKTTLDPKNPPKVIIGAPAKGKGLFPDVKLNL
jgi:HlyD family secretion protein